MEIIALFCRLTVIASIFFGCFLSVGLCMHEKHEQVGTVLGVVGIGFGILTMCFLIGILAVI